MVAGYTTQAHFLIGNGIERLLAPHTDDEIAGAFSSRVSDAAHAARRERRAVQGDRLSRGVDTPLQVFAVRDCWQRRSR
jgi:SAM-dependent MidA family methyltransferase